MAITDSGDDDRVLTATPPWGAPGSSTVTLSWDVDGRLTRVDFPNDSFGQPSFLRMGYTSKGSPSFVADAQGNAVVFEYQKNRKTREARYSGFVDLANRGTLVGDATSSFDTAGRLFRAFNPLFAGNTVYTEYGYDGKGNPIDVTDENAKHDDLFYDQIDRLLEIEQVRTGGTFETGFVYDPASAVTQITDPAAKETNCLTDDLGRLVKVVSPDTAEVLLENRSTYNEPAPPIDPLPISPPPVRAFRATHIEAAIARLAAPGPGATSRAWDCVLCCTGSAAPS